MNNMHELKENALQDELNWEAKSASMYPSGDRISDHSVWGSQKDVDANNVRPLTDSPLLK